MLKPDQGRDGEWTGSRGAAPRISWETSSGQRTWIHSAFALCSLSHTEPCLTDGSVPECPGTRTVWFEVCVPLWGFCGSSAFPQARYTSLFSLLGAQCLGRPNLSGFKPKVHFLLPHPHSWGRSPLSLLCDPHQQAATSGTLPIALADS